MRAPKNDFDLIKKLINFKQDDHKGASVALQKISLHLWYVSELLVPLSLFDSRISADEKKLYIQNMQSIEGLPNPPRRLQIEAEECSSFRDFFTTNSMKFFRILDISTEFLSEDPNTWESNDVYIQARNTVKSLSVVNDHAERAMKLMGTYNRKLTKDEGSFQDLLQLSKNFTGKVNRNKKMTSKNFESLRL